MDIQSQTTALHLGFFLNHKAAFKGIFLGALQAIIICSIGLLSTCTQVQQSAPKLDPKSIDESKFIIQSYSIKQLA